MNPFDRYVQLLKTHDWYYDYTDDHSVWQRGNRERAEITQMYKALGSEVAKETWNKYAPSMYQIK